MELPLLNPYGCTVSLRHPLLSQIPPFLHICLHFPAKYHLGLLTWAWRGAAAGKARCTPLPSSGSQQHFSFSKMILASPNHKQLFFPPLSLTKKKKVLSFLAFLFFFFYLYKPFLAAPPFSLPAAPPANSDAFQPEFSFLFSVERAVG